MIMSLADTPFAEVLDGDETKCSMECKQFATTDGMLFSHCLFFDTPVIGTGSMGFNGDWTCEYSRCKQCQILFNRKESDL